MVHAMLEVDADAGWWDTVPDDVKWDIEQSLQQGNSGEVLKHEQVKAKYGQ